MSITRLCSECGKANKVNLTQVGTMVRCHACGENFKVKSSDTTIKRQKSKSHPAIPDAPKVQASVALENAERELKRSTVPPDINFEDESTAVVKEETGVIEELEGLDEQEPAVPFPVKMTRSLRDRRDERQRREGKERRGETESVQQQAPAAEVGGSLKRGFNRIGLVAGFLAAFSYLLYQSNQLFPWYNPESMTTDMDKYIQSGAFAVALFLASWLVARMAGWAARGFSE